MKLPKIEWELTTGEKNYSSPPKKEEQAYEEGINGTTAEQDEVGIHSHRDIHTQQGKWNIWRAGCLVELQVYAIHLPGLPERSI